jgi:hypothetical protein
MRMRAVGRHRAREAITSRGGHGGSMSADDQLHVVPEERRIARWSGDRSAVRLRVRRRGIIKTPEKTSAE